MVLLLNRYAESGRLMLCLVCSLLAHWLALSLFQDTEKPLRSRMSVDFRSAMVLGQPMQGGAELMEAEEATVYSAAQPAQVGEVAPPAQPAELEVPSQPAEDLYIDPNNVDRIGFAIEIPELPLPADENISSGQLRLKILIGKHGRAEGVEVLETTLPEDYVASLVSAFSQGLFQPAILAGKPVKSWRVIDVNYGEIEIGSNRPAKSGD